MTIPSIGKDARNGPSCNLCCSRHSLAPSSKLVLAFPSRSGPQSMRHRCLSLQHIADVYFNVEIQKSLQTIADVCFNIEVYNKHQTTVCCKLSCLSEGTANRATSLLEHRSCATAGHRRVPRRAGALRSALISSIHKFSNRGSRIPEPLPIFTSTCTLKVEIPQGLGTFFQIEPFESWPYPRPPRSPCPPAPCPPWSCRQPSGEWKPC